MFHETFTRLIPNECANIYGEAFAANKPHQAIDYSSKLKNLNNLKCYLEVLNNDIFDSAFYRRSVKEQDTYIECICEILTHICKVDSAQESNSVNRIFDCILDLCLKLIENLSKTVYKYNREWKRFDLVDIVIEIGNKFEESQIRQYCLNIIWNTYNYDENEDDTETDEINDFHLNKLNKHEDKVRKRSTAFIYVVQSNNLIDQSLRDQKFLRAIKYIVVHNDLDWFDSLDELTKANFMKVIIKFLQYGLKAFVDEMKIFNIEQGNKENEANVIKILCYMNYVFDNLIVTYLKSLVFCVKFNENGLEVIFDILSNTAMLNAFENFKTQQHILNLLQNKLMESCIKCLDRSKCFANKFLPNWHFLNSRTNYCLLRTVAKYYNAYLKNFLPVVLFTISYIDDDDEKQFANIREYVKAKRCKTPEEKEKILEIALNTLKEFSKNPEKAFESRKCLDAIWFIYDTDIIFTPESNRAFIDATYDLVKYGYTRIVDLVKNTKTQNQEEFDEPLLNFIKFGSFMKYIMAKIQHLSNKSIDFCIKYHEKNEDSVRTLFEIITNETFIYVFLKEKSNTFLTYFCEGFYESTFECLRNVSRAAYNFKEYWASFNSFDILLKLSKKFEPLNKYFEISTIMTIANIATIEDLNNLPVSLSIIGQVTVILESMSYELTKSKVGLRVRLQRNENDSQMVEIVKLNKWNFIEIIEALSQFANHDKIKVLMYDTLNVKDHLRRIIYNGNYAEQEYAFQLLRKLCFDKKILQHVREDTELMKAILDNVLENQQMPLQKYLRRNCEGILWLVNSENRNSDNIDNKDLKHIMISYNSEHKVLCMNIKEKLESLGHKTWIDLDAPIGCTIDATSKAIEQAWCVLLCISEKYKDSTDCRTEAEYVAKLKKPCIPVIMHKNYKPEGWLGFMLSSKTQIDFSKQTFDESMSKLTNEVNMYVIKKPVVQKQKSAVEKRPPVLPLAPSPSLKEHPSTESKIPIRKSTAKHTAVHFWTEEDVEKWFNQKKICTAIRLNVSPCDGKVLEQLHVMCQNVPEFYYSTLRSDTKANIKDIAAFTSALKLLFM